MLYNLFCLFLQAKASVGFNEIHAIRWTIQRSNLPKNLKQYYSDKLWLMQLQSK